MKQFVMHAQNLTGSCGTRPINLYLTAKYGNHSEYVPQSIT